MAALGVKESVSGRLYSLTTAGEEVRVCGGKGAVYLSARKVALRCCAAKTTIVVTRKAKQSLLRQGDVGLLDARDTFYANGTLTKYEVVDLDAGIPTALEASAPKPTGSKVATVAGLRVQATRLEHGRGVVTSRFFSSQGSRAAGSSSSAANDISSGSGKQRSPQDVTAVMEIVPASPPSATKKRSAGVVHTTGDDHNRRKDGASASASTQNGIQRVAATMDEDGGTPVKAPRTKKSRIIVDSDAEDDEDDVGAGSASKTGNAAIEVHSDMSSPAEDDDVYMHDVQLRQERDGAGAWMQAFGRGQGALGSGGAWRNARERQHTVTEVIRRRGPSHHMKKLTQPGLGALSARSRDGRVASYDNDEDDEEADHHTRSHDEVGQILVQCDRIAETLRRSIREWSVDSSPTNGASAGSAEPTCLNEAEGHLSLSTINSSTSSGSGGRIIRQTDIPAICETLELKPYQVVGVNWLLLLCENGLSGVLADEMGLGKTVQTIAFILLLNDLATQAGTTKYAGPHLVVVPASVLNNWKREFAWIAPTLRIVVYHGAKDDRLDLQDSLTADDFDVLLTTYTYFERDSCQDDRNFLRNFRFGYMILDEGHSIKNSKTSRFKRISAMRARNRLVLSGTPIQNNLNELLALLSFLMPKMFDHGSDELLTFFDGTEEKKCSKIRKILAPFILRREKKFVLNQLVAKTIVIEKVKLGDDQRKAYTDLVESVIEQKAAQASRKSEDKERKRKSRGKMDRELQLLLGGDYNSTSSKKGQTTSDVAIFTQLRKAANHPVLLRNHYVSDDVLDTMSIRLHHAEAFGNQCSIEMVRKELETYSDFELHDLCVQYSGNEELRKLQLPTDTLLRSAKFDFLRGLLPKLKKDGHRVLIFSQWTKLLDLLEVLMGHMEYRYLRLDGSTDVAERQGMIDAYNQDTNLFVFLLSTRAGGLGINLTAADTVILHDLDFNPTNDEQACDRCHRIGQTKPVTIYKLVSEETVDNDIYNLGESKTQLNNAVLGKLNAHQAGGRKKSDAVTVEMLLSSVLSSYKKE